MKIDRTGVHASHCCPKCGCKYGDADCPVKSGRVEVEYLCEFCEDERESLKEQFSQMSLSELTATIAHLQGLLEKSIQGQVG